MATPRKHWFKVADSILYEDWSDDVKLTVILLMAHLNQRWARDGLTAEEACETRLNRGAWTLITRRQRVDSAALALREAGKSVSLAVSVIGSSIIVKWPKYAEFQGLASRNTPPPQTQTQTQTQTNTQTPKQEASGVEKNTPQPAAAPPAIQTSLVPLNSTAGPLALAPREYAERLAPLLAKKPGTHAEHVEFIDQNLDLMIAELEAEGVNNPARNWGAIKTKLFRWHAQHLRNPNGKPAPESFDERRDRKASEAMDRFVATGVTKP